jgi:hypothetical protein
MKGKNNTTKAKLLMETIVSGQLFNFEAAKIYKKRFRNTFKIYFAHGSLSRQQMLQHLVPLKHLQSMLYAQSLTVKR